MTGRPSASVIAPFAGSQAELTTFLERLAALDTAPGDEVVVVDNRAQAENVVAETVRVLAAGEVSSSWYARNRGVAATRGEWLVFVDADTRPAPDLLASYFEPPPAREVGALVGGVRDWQTSDTLCARYISARRKMDQQNTLANEYAPYGQTANLAVRREVFTAVGGFAESADSAGDADLCWRLQAAGWQLEYRPQAYVDHENRSRLRDLAEQLARHGAGLAWLERRHPGSAPASSPRELLRRAPHYARAAVRAPSRDEALFELLDLAALYVRDVGRARAARRLR